MDPTYTAGYRVIERIGLGGMGVVYRARDNLLERDLALKYIDSGAAPEERVEQLIREAKVASSLQHPGIVTIYGFIAEGPCIAMEYIQGNTLSQCLTEGTLTRDDAVRLSLELAEALHYAHQSGVVHADIKPANIMIDRSGRAKVLDFGLSRWRLAGELQTLSHSGDQLRRLAGTIPYMSPELILGHRIDCRGDIFSLGCVLFEIFTGHRPFPGENPAAILNQLLNDPPRGVGTLRRNVPKALADIVLHMLEKEPARRIPSLAQVIPVLRKLCGNTDGQTTFSAPGRFSAPGIRRIGILLALTLLGLLLYSFPEPDTSGRQLRVFLAQPEYYREGGGTPLDAILWSSVVSGLHLLRSAQPILYHEPPAAGTSPAELARLAGSDEWIQISHQPENPLGNVLLLRVRTDDGALLGQVRFFVHESHLKQAAHAATSQTLAVYGDHEPRDSISFSAVSSEDYLKFVEIYSELNQGIGDRVDQFAGLYKLTSKTSGFLAAESMAADMALDLFSDTRDNLYLEQATMLISKLRLYHPNPTVVIQKEIAFAIHSRNFSLAERKLAMLSETSPGDPSILLLKSKLAEQQGNSKRALLLIAEASDKIPISWNTRYHAASLAIRMGDVESARTQINAILALTPENSLALGQYGLVELLYGDLDSSISIYEKLLDRKKHRSYLNNIGLALMLKKNYSEAKARFSQALELQPEHPITLLNLADTENALGNEEIARDLYQKALAAQRNAEGASPHHKMIEAQCLARLGHFGAAIETTLEVLSKSSTNPETAYQAALVYALAGEHESAIVNSRAALRGGLDIRWFSLPIFSHILDAIEPQDVH